LSKLTFSHQRVAINMQTLPITYFPLRVCVSLTELASEETRQLAYEHLALPFKRRKPKEERAYGVPKIAEATAYMGRLTRLTFDLGCTQARCDPDTRAARIIWMGLKAHEVHLPCTLGTYTRVMCQSVTRSLSACSWTYTKSDFVLSIRLAHSIYEALGFLGPLRQVQLGVEISSHEKLVKKQLPADQW